MEKPPDHHGVEDAFDKPPVEPVERAGLLATVISLLFEPAKLITLLGASSAGLAIFLGVIGFLAVGAHETLLGLPRLSHTNDEYVAAGSLFFPRTLLFMAASFLDGLAPWLFTGAVVLGLGALGLGRTRPAREAYGLAALVLLALVLVATLWLLAQAAECRGLLLQGQVSDENPVLTHLRKHDESWLQGRYGGLAVGVLCTAVWFKVLEDTFGPAAATPGPFAWGRSCWRWARIPGLVGVLICLFLLARAYGILTFPNRYPLLTAVAPADLLAQVAPGKDRAVVLHEGEKTLLIYFPDRQSLLQLDRGDVKAFSVTTPQAVP
jgi:hypothetical protein